MQLNVQMPGDIMKRQMVFILLVLALVFYVQGCYGPCEAKWSRSRIRGSGDVISEEREIDGIHGVKLATIGNLFIEIGDKEELIIEAEDNLLDYIETDVRRGILKIDNRRNANLSPRRQIRYYLTVKELDEIAISSSGNIKAPDLKARRFAIDISSSGDLEMGALEATDLEVNISSSGDIEIEKLHAGTLEVDISSSGNLVIDGGEVEDQDISITSSGDYKARNLESREARVRVSSSGNATVRVSDYLDAQTSSSGDIYYYGNPDVDEHSSSSGDIRRVGRGSRRRTI